MKAEIHARSLRSIRLRFFAALLPPGGAAWLAWLDRPAAAALFFVTGFTVMTIGTLMPRCALFGRMIKRLPPGPNHALLTIDDGPHPEHTPVILDLLDRHGLKAVFFLIGDRAAAHPHLVREILVRGHEIGNHTQTHPATTFWALRPRHLWREIATCQETLTRLCPESPPRFFRPPAGHHNIFLPAITRALGLRILMWDARGFDGVRTDVERITRRIRERLKPGSIVLIHEATPVAVEVAEAVAALFEPGRLASADPSKLAFSDD